MLRPCASVTGTADESRHRSSADCRLVVCVDALGSHCSQLRKPADRLNVAQLGAAHEDLRRSRGARPNRSGNAESPITPKTRTHIPDTFGSDAARQVRAPLHPGGEVGDIVRGLRNRRPCVDQRLNDDAPFRASW